MIPPNALSALPEKSPTLASRHGRDPIRTGLEPQAYRDSVLLPDVTKRVAVELGIDQGWCKYIGRCGRFLGINHFGASAPVGVLLKHYGFTVENLVRLAKEAAER